MAQIVDPDFGQFGLLLDVDPESPDFLHRLAGRFAGEQPRIALRHQKSALAHDGRDVGRDRDAMDLALLGGRRWF